MEPQLPPAPCSPSPAHHSQPQHHPQLRLSNPAAYADYHHVYSEKDNHSHHHSIRSDRLSKSSCRRAHDSVISHPFSPKPSSPPSPSSNSSISSIGHHPNSTNSHRYSSSHPDRQSISYPPQAHLDPEKHAEAISQAHRLSNRLSALPSGADAIVYDKGAYQEKGPEEKAWQLLLWLCGPCAFLSGAIALWTFCALFIALLLSPLRLCTARAPLAEQIKSLLAPPLNLQLHMVYSHDSTTGYSAPMLVVIHLFSPLVAFGVAIAAWTAAGFWFFSCILGDPGGHDGHNDGRESIVAVRNWWERWLSRGLRETDA
jgi:hypothetical protein